MDKSKRIKIWLPSTAAEAIKKLHDEYIEKHYDIQYSEEEECHIELTGDNVWIKPSRTCYHIRKPKLVWVHTWYILDNNGKEVFLRKAIE